MQPITFQHFGQLIEIQPGIHFGLNEDIYHAIPALSSTGLKNVLISAPDFYFNSWLNPLRNEDQEDGEALEWRRFGKATHSRILEGKTRFDEDYVVEFIPPEGCLKTKDDLKKYCDDNAIENKTSWTKPKFIDAIKFAGHKPLIYDDAEAAYFRETGGKIQMTEKEMRRIEIAASMIEKHPELKHAFTGGIPEVSVIWEKDGLPFKARLDYLKPRAIVDLKSFTNKRHKPIDMALHEAVANMKYHIQVALYIEAGREAIRYVRDNRITVYNPQRNTPPDTFLAALQQSEGQEFYNVFQKKGGAPLARGKKFNANLNMMKCAEASIAQAITMFKHYSALYGTGVWVDDSSITDFEDALFPIWATEI